MIINDTGKDSNGATASGIYVHFAGDQAVISHKKLLISRVIRMRQEEVPVLVSPKEPIIVANNKPAMNASTGVIQITQALNTPIM